MQVVNETAIVARAARQPTCVSAEKGARRAALVLGVRGVHEHDPGGKGQKKRAVLKV